MIKLPIHYPAACPDCPGSHLGMLQPLVGETKHSCAFVTEHVPAREPLPAAWGEFDFALVRRGVVIRQRVDVDGSTSAIDAAGPGSAFPIDPDFAGYATSDVLVCLCPRETMDRAVRSGEVAADALALQRAALARVERLAHARAAGTVRQKTARVLVALAETLSPWKTRDDLPHGLQQRDIAALVGVRHETLNRMLATLETEGLLRRQAGTIERLDLAGLRAVV